MIDKREFEPLLVCEKTAARLMGVSHGMLVAGRFNGRPLLPFVRIGRRMIRYRVSDIEAMIRDKVQHGATQPLPATSSPQAI